MMKLFLTAALLASGLGSTAANAGVEIIVPAYFFPSAAGSDWDRLTAAVQSGVPITAIVNPGSGPGLAASSDYTRAISTFRAAGGKVLGYVPSGYIGQQVNAGSTCQPAAGNTYSVADVVGCAARYDSFYAIDGIFVDEFGAPAVGAPEADVSTFYQSVYDGIRGINASYSIFGNPGQSAPEGLLRNGTMGGADTLVTFENVASVYFSTPPATYTSNYPANRFANILIESGPGFDVQSAVALANARGVGFFYATDDVRPNPYDALPSYFDAEVDAVRRANAVAGVPEPSAWAMFIIGFALIGRTLRQRRKTSDKLLAGISNN